MEPSLVPSVLKAPRGFSLVELIVVLGLIVLLTAITLTSQSSYNRQLILTSTTYTVAMSIREAQSLGLSSRMFGTTQNAGYGVHLSKADLTSYSIFSDISSAVYTKGSSCPIVSDNTLPEWKPGNCLFDNNTEVVTPYTLNKGFTIADFCGIYLNNDQQLTRACASGTASRNAMESMDVVFLRPNTEAIMTGLTTDLRKREYLCARIYIASPAGGNKKCIYISKVGQVSVPQSCPQDVTTFVDCS